MAFIIFISGLFSISPTRTVPMKAFLISAPITTTRLLTRSRLRISSSLATGTKSTALSTNSISSLKLWKHDDITVSWISTHSEGCKIQHIIESFEPESGSTFQCNAAQFLRAWLLFEVLTLCSLLHLVRLPCRRRRECTTGATVGKTEVFKEKPAPVPHYPT